MANPATLGRCGSVPAMTKMLPSELPEGLGHRPANSLQMTMVMVQLGTGDGFISPAMAAQDLLLALGELARQSAEFYTLMQEIMAQPYVEAAHDLSVLAFELRDTLAPWWA